MNFDQSRPSAELDDLLTLIKTGQLFAVQKWVAAQWTSCSSEIFAVDARTSHLVYAVRTGFHSMVEVLIKAGGWPQPQLDQAYDLALANHRSDIARLLRDNGATMEALDFEEVCRSMNSNFMEEALRNGCSPVRGNAFAQALRRFAAARPLLSFYRKMRGEFPELDNQAALALAIAAREGKARAAALLAWAGADPFREVPYDIDDDDWNFGEGEERHCTTTAAECAVGSGKVEIIKSLKLKPTLVQARDLLARASLNPSKELAQVLMAMLPDKNLNVSERGSCPALEELVRKGSFAMFSSYPSSTENAKALECMESLLDAGARWNPEPDELRYVRRNLLEHDPLYVVRVIRLLLYTPKAADPKLILELCRTPKGRQQMTTGDPKLWEELTALAKGEPLYGSPPAAME
jgi:hypothetical protein